MARHWTSSGLALTTLITLITLSLADAQGPTPVTTFVPSSVSGWAPPSGVTSFTVTLWGGGGGGGIWINACAAGGGSGAAVIGRVIDGFENDSTWDITIGQGGGGGERFGGDGGASAFVGYSLDGSEFYRLMAYGGGGGNANSFTCYGGGGGGASSSASGSTGGSGNPPGATGGAEGAEVNGTKAGGSGGGSNTPNGANWGSSWQGGQGQSDDFCHSSGGAAGFNGNGGPAFQGGEKKRNGKSSSADERRRTAKRATPWDAAPNSGAGGGTSYSCNGLYDLTAGSGGSGGCVISYILPASTASPSVSATPSISSSPPPPTRTPSVTPTKSITPSATPTISQTPSVTPTRSITPSQTPTRTPSISPTKSVTPTISRTPSPSRSPSSSSTVTPTISVSPTMSTTPSPTRSRSPTPSTTASNTPSTSPSRSATPTISITPTFSPSPSPSSTATPTISVTPSSTSSPAPSESASPSPSISVTPSATPSASPSPSVSPSAPPVCAISVWGSWVSTNAPFPFIDSGAFASELEKAIKAIGVGLSLAEVDNSSTSANVVAPNEVEFESTIFVLQNQSSGVNGVIYRAVVDALGVITGGSLGSVSLTIQSAISCPPVVVRRCLQVAGKLESGLSFTHLGAQHVGVADNASLESDLVASLSDALSETNVYASVESITSDSVVAVPREAPNTVQVALRVVFSIEENKLAQADSALWLAVTRALNAVVQVEGDAPLFEGFITITPCHTTF